MSITAKKPGEVAPTQVTRKPLPGGGKSEPEFKKPSERTPFPPFL
jgi:hypothetical protein